MGFEGIGASVKRKEDHRFLSGRGNYVDDINRPGQLYAVTTNPREATGDGLAMALRAGVAVADVEFMQFHPTALHHPAMPRPLLSEALRGHGAVLRDAAGVGARPNRSRRRTPSSRSTPSRPNTPSRTRPKRRLSSPSCRISALRRPAARPIRPTLPPRRQLTPLHPSRPVAEPSARPGSARSRPWPRSPRPAHCLSS